MHEHIKTIGQSMTELSMLQQILPARLSGSDIAILSRVGWTESAYTKFGGKA